MIMKLKELNFRVILWIHPFIWCKSFQFIHYWRRGVLINTSILSSMINLITERSHSLQLTFDDFLSNLQFQAFIHFIQYIYQRLFLSLSGIFLWWNNLAGVLDWTNESTREEYPSNLQHLQKKLMRSMVLNSMLVK